MELVRGLSPRSRVRGALRPPGSKSIAQRVLVTALLSPDATEVVGLPDGADVAACLGLLSEAGAAIERLAPGHVRVRGPGAAGLLPSGYAAVGESGTLARFATSVLALCRHSQARVGLHATGTLPGRPGGALFAALRAAGAEVDCLQEPESWPVRIRSTLAPAELRLANPVSSQELSALWIAAAAQPHPVRVLVQGTVPSAPYLALTRRVLEQFGAVLEGQVSELLVRGPLRPPGERIAIEPDASSAAVALAAACLSEGELLVPGIPSDSLQGDVRAVERLAAFGCEAGHRDGGLAARGFPARGAALDLAAEPDLAPVMAAVAAGAARRHGQASRLTGLGTLTGKESDRIAVLARGLRTCGFTVAASSSSLEIAATVNPERSQPVGERIVLDPHGDHRMAFAFALLGLFVPHVFVTNAACVSKSWPGFWEDLAALGADVVEGD